jgi:hypothetical protein
MVAPSFITTKKPHVFDEGGASAAGAGGHRYVSNRPPDGCFTLAAPPFESDIDTPEFGFAISCIGRTTPLFLFANSADERNEWMAALGRTFLY